MLPPHFLRELATLLASGIAPAQALLSLAKHHQAEAWRLQRIAQQLEQGSDFATASKGLWSAYDQEILRVAELAGQLPVAVLTLAQRAEQRLARQQRVASRFWLPRLVLLVAAIAGLCVRWLQAPALWVLALLHTGAIVAVLWWLGQQLSRALQQPLSAWANQLWRWRLVPRWSVATHVVEQYWYQLLMWQIAAGVNYQSALTALIEVMPASDFRVALRRCVRLVADGESLALALRRSGLVWSAELKTVLHVAEQSGQMESALTHYLQQQEKQMQIQLRELDAWLPRGYYVVVVGVAMRWLV